MSLVNRLRAVLSLEKAQQLPVALRASLTVVKACAALSFLLLSMLPAKAQIVYSNDFEANTNGFNSGSTTALPTTNGGFASTPSSTFLGQFANGTVDLALSGLTIGTTYTVAFDLFIGRTWDGNGTVFGPDTWRLQANGSDLVNTTFNVILPADGFTNDTTQNYSDSNPIGSGANLSFAGADVAQTSGGLPERYGIYRFSNGAGNPTLSFFATGTTATLSFTGSGLQDVSDEFWAIDNVVVRTAAVVPEAGTLCLLGCALVPVALVVRRRRSTVNTR